MSKQFYLTINGMKVEVSEEVYREYKKPVWKEKKRKQRNMRCRDGNCIRCHEDCTFCEYARQQGGSQGSDISLEAHMALGADIAADYDLMEYVEEKRRSESIRAEIMKFEETDKMIAAMLMEGYKQKEIAISVGVEPYDVNRRIKRMQKKLKKFI